jgi:ferritin-like metal-binding protein YciE
MTQHTSLVEVYVAALTDLHSAERLLSEALPAVVDAAADPQLREILSESAAQVPRQIADVAQILSCLGRDVQKTSAPAMAALLERVGKTIETASMTRVYSPADLRIRDAALIVEWRKVGHHRIAGYAGACALAEVGENDHDAEVLHRSLRETVEVDEDLADLANGIINVQAPW